MAFDIGIYEIRKWKGGEKNKAGEFWQKKLTKRTKPV